MQFEFVAHISRLDHSFRYHYVPLPAEAYEAYEEASVTRLIVSFNDIEQRRAMQRTKEGERFVIISQAIMRKAKVQFGEPVFVVTRADPNPDYIELGEEFEAVLAEDEAAANRFFGMTPGRQRSLAGYITSAKRPETRIKRALDIAMKLRTHTLHSDK